MRKIAYNEIKLKCKHKYKIKYKRKGDVNYAKRGSFKLN